MDHSAATAVCGLCQQPRGSLQCLARQGALLNVCQVCFCCEELKQLSAQLPSGHPTVSLIEEGLQTLYSVAKAEVEAQVAGSR